MQGALLVLPKPSMRAQELRLSVLLEMVCARDVHTGNMCRRVGSRALRVGITHPASCLLAASPGSRLPWSPVTQQPEVGNAPAWSLPGAVASLSPQLLPLLANQVLGVGFEVNGDVCSEVLLAWVWGNWL